MQFPGENMKTKASREGYQLRSNCVNLSYVQMSALKLTCVQSVSLHRPV